MALDPKGAALALHRFGFAPRPNSIAAIAPNPRGDTALGPLASAETRRLVAGAETKPQALTFLTMAPEFQRR